MIDHTKTFGSHLSHSLWDFEVGSGQASPHPFPKQKVRDSKQRGTCSPCGIASP